MEIDNWLLVSNPPVPAYYIFMLPIERSQQDDRTYRLIRLENGLQAMLVHDAKADQAAASLNVAVGHLSDPDDMPGMAHFCEHLSFMGTEQYPRENEYSEFLKKNNGSSNAYTAASNTVYHFKVASPLLSQALPRFAAFFHSPLFSPSCISREVNAIDSENKKNLLVDSRRIYQLTKRLCIDGHVWSKFGSGNRETLSSAARNILRMGDDCTTESSVSSTPIQRRIPSPGPSLVLSSVDNETSTRDDDPLVGFEMRRRLVEWWTQEYCASRMRLCVIGNESLEELADLTSQLFSPVLNRGQVSIPLISQHPFGPNEKSTLVMVQSVKSLFSLELSFPLEWQLPYWRYKPAYFIANLVGHEGPGSLHAYLRHQGWITSLVASPYNPARGFGMFRVTIRLTSDGFHHYRQVLLTLFKYLEMIRSQRILSYLQHEQSTLSKIRFRFAEKGRPDTYAVWVSECMLWPVPPELLIQAPYVTEPWDEEVGSAEREYQKVLGMLRVDQARAMLIAKDEELRSVCGAATQWDIEPWYSTPYRVERFDEEFLKLASSPNGIPELFLPRPNEFIPDKLNVEKEPVAKPLKCPSLIRTTPLSTVWYKKDDQFWVPKAHIILKIQTPITNNTARNWVMTNLYSDLVHDFLAESTYQAMLAGLGYTLFSVPTGLCIAVSGYNDKIAILTKNVIQVAKNLVVDVKRLEVMKEKARRRLKNFSLGQPYTISKWQVYYLLTKRQWTMDERLSELASITVEELQRHVDLLLSNAKLSILIIGNLRQDESLNIVEMIEETLDSSPLPAPLIEPALILPPSSNFVWEEPNSNPAEGNSSLTYYVHVGRLTIQRTRIVLALLVQILSEPAFDVLRTKEQLGYLVFCSSWGLRGSYDGGISIVVQSEQRPEFLERRVEAFLSGMKTVIEDMSQDHFEEQKGGLERKWRQALKNLSEEANLYWSYIDSGQLEFTRLEHDADLLKEIKKEDVLSMFLEAVYPRSATRAKLSVHLYSRMLLPQKITLAFAEAFEQLVKSSGLIDNGRSSTWRDDLDNDGTYSRTGFERHWREFLGESEAARGLIRAIPRLLEAERMETERPSNGDVVYIHDAKTFKASLKVSECNGLFLSGTMLQQEHRNCTNGGIDDQEGHKNVLL